MKKFATFFLVMLMVFAASVFMVGCGGDDGGSDSNAIPDDFIGTWNLMLMQDVGDTDILYPLTDTFSTFTIAKDGDQGTYALVVNIAGNMYSDAGLAEWEVRDGVKYLIGTDANNETGEMRIDNYDTYICEATAIDAVEGNSYWAMARGNGIFGIIKDYADYSAIQGAQVSVFDKDGNQVGTTKNTNQYGLYYFPAVDEALFPITVVATASAYQDYTYPITSAQTSPTFANMNMMPPVPTGTVSGTLTDASDNTSLMGTQVTVQIGTDYSVISDMGSYTIANIPTGMYSVTASATDYNTYTGTIQVVEGSNSYNIALTPVSASTGTVQGIIYDIDTYNAITQSVTVTVGSQTQTFTGGSYTFTNVPLGTVGVAAASEGYETYTNMINVNAGLNTLDIGMTPQGVQYGDLAKIELYWGANSADLDLYTRTASDVDVYYANQGSLSSSPYLYHNGDEQDGPGPEVIDVAMLTSGTYHVYAKDWNDTFATDGAYCVFKDEYDNILETIYASSGDGEWWYIATIDGTTENINEVDTFSDDHPLDGGGSPDTHVGTVTMAWTASGWDFDLMCHTPVINGSARYITYDNPGSLSSSPYIWHMGDETSGPASESILISQPFSGNYYFYVETWDGSFSAGGCSTEVYNNEGTHLSTVNASSATGSGDIWVIGYMSGSDGQWHTLNQLRTSAPVMKYATERQAPRNK